MFLVYFNLKIKRIYIKLTHVCDDELMRKSHDGHFESAEKSTRRKHQQHFIRAAAKISTVCQKVVTRFIE